MLTSFYLLILSIHLPVSFTPLLHYNSVNLVISLLVTLTSVLNFYWILYLPFRSCSQISLTCDMDWFCSRLQSLASQVCSCIEERNCKKSHKNVTQGLFDSFFLCRHPFRINAFFRHQYSLSLSSLYSLSLD